MKGIILTEEFSRMSMQRYLYVRRTKHLEAGQN
jgi:hypothetical protein